MTSNSSNYVAVTSPEQFQQLLSADLNRLSILNFRAEWAGPCAQMDGVAKELAQKFPQALFLEVRGPLFLNSWCLMMFND